MRLATAALVFASAAVATEPYVPASDAEVLAQVPTAQLEDSTLRQLRMQHRNAPADIDVAVHLAWRYVQLARQTGALRYLGYAQAALASWWTLDAPPPQVTQVRASIAQSRHQFDRALDDLRQVLAHRPRDASTWLTLSVIQKIKGRTRQALDACKPLLRLATPTLRTACRANALAMTPRAAHAYEDLSAVLRASGTTSSQQRQWALWVQAGIAAELGFDDAADRHFTEALAVAPPELNLLIAYADHLLDTRRFRAVLELLKDRPRSAPIVLRTTIAATRMGNAEVSADREWLRAHFTDARLRGDTGQFGDEARFELHVLANPQRAMELALLNYEAHREPRDINLLLDAALASQSRDALIQVRRWLERAGYVTDGADQRLAQLRTSANQDISARNQS